MKHTGPISSVASHGPYVATGGYDNRVILWQAASRRALARGMHDHLVNHVAFSADGKLLVSSGCDNSARIWQIPSLRLAAVLCEHDDDVDMAVFGPDNTRVATCALDRALRIFDLSGRCLKTFRGHTGNIISLLWSADGERLISSSVDGTVREWDVAGGAELSCHNLDGVRTDTIVIDARGRIIAGDDAGRISVIAAGRPSFFEAHRAGVKKLVCDTERQQLTSLSYDGTLALWQIGADGELSELRRGALPAIVWPRAAAALDQDRLAAATFGTRYATYDWRSGSWDTEGIEAGDGINAIVHHRGSRYTVGDAGVVRRDGVPLTRLGSLCNFLLAAGTRLYAGGQLGHLFDVDSGAVLYAHHSPLNCGALFARAGRPHIAIGSYTGEIVVFSLLPERAIRLERRLKVYDNAVKGLAANERQLFSVCASTDIAWHDCADLGLARRVERAHEKIANACCALGESGFASVGRDRTLRIWLDGVAQVYPSPHLHSVKSLCASADGATLMTGSYGGTLASFDLATRAWGAVRRPTSAGIASICHDPDAGVFLAASYDGAVYPAAPLDGGEAS